MDLRFNKEDASQVMIGSFSLSVPIAFTEEAWNLGESLPWINLLLVLLLSMGSIALFAHQSVFEGDIKNRVLHFMLRLLLGYALALAVVFIVLLALDRLPLLEDPMTALRRILVIGMPASMGAVIVDGLDKEKWT